MNELKININKKYKTKNIISRYLLTNFDNTIKKVVGKTKFKTLADIGCGEGIILNMLQNQLKTKKCIGIDIDPLNIKLSRENVSFCEFAEGDIYQLPFENSNFDLVVCLEVLEHLEDPEKALAELKRITNEFIIISVPDEPIWRLFNMLRGKYFKTLGNTPGHLNNWSTKSIKRIVNKYFQVIETYKPLPWTIILAKSK